jgi:hypothetical protein
VASFRDRYNPETIHFPAGLTSKFLILVGWGVCVLAAIACLLTHQPAWRTIVELVFLGAIAAFLYFCWPQDLRIELRGVAGVGLMRKRTFIAWSEVELAKPETRHFGPWARVEYYVIGSKNGVRIRHTERHPDRERFVFELKRHGVNAADAFEE